MEEIFLRLQSLIKEIIRTNLVEMQKIKINQEINKLKKNRKTNK